MEVETVDGAPTLILTGAIVRSAVNQVKTIQEYPLAAGWAVGEPEAQLGIMAPAVVFEFAAEEATRKAQPEVFFRFDDRAGKQAPAIFVVAVTEFDTAVESPEGFPVGEPGRDRGKLLVGTCLRWLVRVNRRGDITGQGLTAVEAEINSEFGRHLPPLADSEVGVDAFSIFVEALLNRGAYLCPIPRSGPQSESSAFSICRVTLG